MASGETLPILKEVFVQMTLGWSPIRIYVLIAEITDELILELDILHTYGTFMDVGHVHGATGSGRNIRMEPPGTASVSLPFVGQRPHDTSTVEGLVVA
jgi:hypothetical protein